MTVHARGYRRYRGSLRAPPVALAIARSGLSVAVRRRSFVWIGIAYLIWLAVSAFVLYLSVGTMLGGPFERTVQALTGQSRAVALLGEVLRLFYSGVSYLSALLAVFVGAPLIADDLKSGAIVLYLVRPIRSFDYALGKALVIPGILAGALLLPGIFFYVLTAMWQPPGESIPFLVDNVDIALRVFEHTATAAAAYSGLMLLLSSRTQRRAMAAVLAGAILFTGVMLAGVARDAQIGGRIGDLFSLLDLPADTMAVILPHVVSFQLAPEPLPALAGVRILAASLFIVGFLAAWRRARSVEVTT